MAAEGNDPYGRPARPIRTRLIVALVLLAFLGGLAAMAWIMTQWKGRSGADQSATAQSETEVNAAATSTTAAAVEPSAGPTPGKATPAPKPAAPAPKTDSATTPAMSAAELDQHILDLEQRLMRVSVAAQAASGYANRAEAMMVAFAARRALDSGGQLGYIEGQLRLLFGEAQPKAVATIINAANEPVTINKLRAGLEDIRVLLQKGDPNQSWWQAAMHQLGALVEIRHADTPAPEPEQRIAHARRAIEAGQIDDAMNDVAALPQQPAISQWLEQARRYNEAHRALDVIEAAAILEPRAAPLVAPAGQPAAASRTPSRGKR